MCLMLLSAGASMDLPRSLRCQFLDVHLDGSVYVLAGARCWVDHNHLSCVCLLSSAYQCESSEDLRSSAGTLALWHTPSLYLGFKEGKFDVDSTVGEIHSLGVHQSRAGCEVRGPDSLVVETRGHVLTAPYSSHIIVPVDFNCLGVLLTITLNLCVVTVLYFSIFTNNSIS